MKRRKFLKIAGSVITLSPWLEQLIIGADDSGALWGIYDDSANTNILSLFESSNEEVLAFTDAFFHKCILDKIMQPTQKV